MADTEALYEFDATFQRKIAALFLRNGTFAAQTKDLIKPEYFGEDAVGVLIRIVKEHYTIYRSVPDLKILPTILKEQIDKKMIRKDVIPDLKLILSDILKTDISNPDFVKDRVSDFAKHQAIESAIMASVGLLEKGKFDEIAEVIKKAVSVGAAMKSDDYDYFEEIKTRTQKREDIMTGKIVKRGITSGYAGIDCHLYHNGWGRKELSCIMGPAKSGKSMSLGDFSKNASLAGYNVLYVSLEVAKEIIAERIDAALSDTIMNDLPKNFATVESAITTAHKGAGRFKIRDFASGTFSPSMLRLLLDEYLADGIVFDLVALDYADIMAPDHRSDDLRENLRTIYIDLRAIAYDYDLAMLTATQTNRAGAMSSTAKATDVGDDWNKARTVDILIGLNATDAEKTAGKARLYWALSRNTADGFTVEIQQDRAKMKFIQKVLGVK